ncbi:Leucine-rich repeat-containing G-protein coupled receptor 5 [Holothuria leucospilota]|uniref:Leucine-rich repeat-containing G-protein coupled receptor 5 n=1 Tax=Holothuria leucospilota TaxID=206669 RepID=A0A9Q1CRW0_HOLLE|nr:Leucine-rich repeat-containing G-protein coupled receptor 5 [Holothuria leucospilota]
MYYLKKKTQQTCLNSDCVFDSHRSLCGNNLTEIPEDLFTRVEDLQFLTLCRNNITSIDKTALNGSMDLQLLDLTTNKLSSLPKDLFSGVNLGKALDLSENEIEEIPDGLFCSNKVHYHNLTWLLIRNNKLVSLTKTCFKGLRYLTHIFLNGNNIEKLGDSVFEGTSVQFIYIFSNNLTKISSKSFNTEFLQEIQIYKNRITTISADDFDTRLGSILIYLHCYDLEKIPTLSSQVEATCITGDFVPKIAVNAKSTVAQFGINLEEDGFNCSFHDLKPECTPCLPGTYDDGTNECRSCPAGGYFQDDFGLMDCKVCKKGTFVKSPGGKSVQDCELCPEGTDLARHAGHRACFCKMNYARVGRFQPCSLCLEEGLNCSRDFKSLQPGYYWNWSFPGANLTAYSNFVLHLENDSPNYNLSSKQYRQLIPKVHGCPLRDSCENKGSYMAGNITGNCKHGYRGWLCSKCQNSFYSIRNTCIKCPDKKWIILETIVILSLGIGLYVFMTWQNRRHGNCDKNERSLVDKVSSQMKIALGFYQVIGELFESFHDIPWIGPLKFLEQLISFLKLNVFRLFFRPHCYSEKLKINIKIQFILSLSFPFVMFFLFASFYHMWKLYLRYKFRNATIQTFKKLKKLREKLYTYILILLFITYPPTCDVIFKLYPDACKTFFIYENDTTVNITLLRSDFDLDCKSLKIYQFYAFIATVVYVASFPCVLLMILKTYSKKIVTTQANGEQFSNNQYEPGTAMNDGAHLINETREHIRIPVWIKFLCENYKPQYWYWEIIELTRKVTQTILVTLLGWENTLTKLLTIGISVLFLTLHARLSPMTSAFEQRLQVMFSLSAIFINVLIAAVPIPQIYRAPLATILILMNMIIILVIAGEIALFIFRVVKGQMTRKQEER